MVYVACIAVSLMCTAWCGIELGAVRMSNGPLVHDREPAALMSSLDMVIDPTSEHLDRDRFIGFTNRRRWCGEDDAAARCTVPLVRRRSALADCAGEA